MANYQRMREQSKHRRKHTLLAQACLSVVIVGLLFANSYAVVKLFHGQPVFTLPALSLGAPASSASAPPSDSTVSDSGAGQPADTAEEAWNTNQVLPRTVNADVPLAQVMQMLAVPQNGKVSLEYFRDALFLGDSLIEGFALYKPLSEPGSAIFYSARGASPQFFLNDGAGILNRDCPTQRETEHVWTDISGETPGKVYMLIATNAIQTMDDDGFMHYYTQLMDKITATFPGVPVYVMGITPPAKEKAETDSNYSLTRIHTLNNRIAWEAANRGMYYVDTHEALADSEGYLREDLAGYDGLHLSSGEGYNIWLDYLRTHTVYSPANLVYVEEGPYT